jgi:hypothetical protein
MMIGADPFSGGAPAPLSVREPAGRPNRPAAFVECGVCGFEPAEQAEMPQGRCVKCGGQKWNRTYRPAAPTAAQTAPPRGTGRARAVPVMRESNRVFLPKVLGRPVFPRTATRVAKPLGRPVESGAGAAR